MKTPTAFGPSSVYAILALTPLILSFAIGQPARIRIPLEVHDAGNGKATLWFGVHSDATRCVDDTLKNFCDGGIIVEQQLPPNACSFGIFDARFLDPRGPSIDCFDLGLRNDIHPSLSRTQADTFKIRYCAGNPGGFPITIKWPLALGFSYDSARIKDGITGGTLYNANMMTADSLVVLNQFITEVIMITYGPHCPSDRISPDGKSVPSGFILYQNYPNPFNPSSTITFGIHKSAVVDVTVFDVLGRKVATLASGEFTAGYYTATWNGTDEKGTEASSGVYYVRMLAGSDAGPDHEAFSAFRKLLLIR